MVAGVVIPEMLKGVPASEIDDRTKFVLPTLEMVRAPFTVDPTATVPRFRLVGLRLICGADEGEDLEAPALTSPVQPAHMATEASKVSVADGGRLFLHA